MPRLAAGDSVVLLLRPFRSVYPSLRYGMDSTGFVVLHPLDRQPPGNLALVKEALR
jgi:hypothetical protein